jgi:fatty-acyl-CoA synthase
MFLRLKREIDATSTFKQRKIDLVREGFDPQKTDDPLYFKDPERGEYVPLDAALFERIQSGALRL